jgi:hypothetical protein
MEISLRQLRANRFSVKDFLTADFTCELPQKDCYQSTVKVVE